MKTLKDLFAANRRWAEEMRSQDEDFFLRLSRVQNPDYLWIGCADSRVPANDIVGLLPGELFVHRNVANLVVHTDFNMLSVLQYAIEVLKIQHVIVCGHYGCGGVKSAMNGASLGLADNWLRNVKDVYQKHRDTLEAEKDLERRSDLLCELNVFEQSRHVAQTTIVQNAWKRGQRVEIHGWIYAVRDGLLKDLSVEIDSAAALDSVYRL